ncbi:MAG TPA: ABC transporter permease [Anaerolineaceae bacterium]|nr:ABC transporter permease [Anaerolineaceae bacterium]
MTLKAQSESPITILRPTRGWSALNLRELWLYRELIYFLTWRDLKVRYKQTVLGVTWIILQPVVEMFVFTLLFGGLLNVPSGGVPYPIFAFAALLPWNYFQGALTRSSTTLVGSANLISKVYFPRLVIPISGVLSGMVDFAVSFVVMIVLMVVYRIQPSWAMLLLPVFLLLAMLTALGFGMWLSALNVRFRDINHMVPYLVRVWMYVTPVIYGSNLVQPTSQFYEIYRAVLTLNPMSGVVEGFRWALLGNQLTDATAPSLVILAGVVVTLVVLVSGAVFFRSTERTFADII